MTGVVRLVLLRGAAGGTPAPEVPELREGLDPLDVSPGVLGFIVIFLVVLACIPLFRSMTSKLRGVEHRDRQALADDDVASGEARPADGVGSTGPTTPPGPARQAGDDGPVVDGRTGPTGGPDDGRTTSV